MKRVLIVDDERVFLLSLLEGLKAYSKHFKAEIAEDGVEALEKLAAGSFDLVVTDLRMPRLDGMELLARMSKLHPSIPVIVMTAYPTPNAIETTRGLGCSKFLEKPIDLADLAQKILDELSSDSAGFLKGIPLSTFLQLVEMEGKTYTIKVMSGKRTGWLYFLNGELLQAEMGQLEGLEAAFKIVSWKNPEIEISNRCRKQVNEINTPLSRLILESMRRFDEANEGREEEEEFSVDEIFESTPEVSAEPAPTPKSSRAAPLETPPEPPVKADDPAASVEESDAAGVEAALRWTNLQQQLSEFKDLSGFKGAGIFENASDKGIWLQGEDLHLERAAEVLMDLQHTAEALCSGMESGACRLVEVETDKGYLLSKRLSGEDANVVGRRYLNLILDDTGEVARSKLKMNAFTEGGLTH
jgi:CheY-like chemotaxis protein